ncbi:hypothetical protein [Kitasatospora herbaricolor]|uniref:Uncharacterized protein n=1 Tax=Kitasatospora herbaricolor TaxID=68217 RepID=A0ABZ1W289_9ACTN|nr:hypothetical protein [Kitasatospora herbaricolor]
MKEFDRERAHRKSEDLADLKDEPDEKNTEHIERIRRTEHETGRSGPKADAPPQEQPGD